jgi:hypothetical protein
MTLLTAPASAETSWVSIKDLSGVGEACLDVGGRRFEYAVIEGTDVATCVVAGPRRLKLISRYLFAEDDLDRVPYSVILSVDGREVLRKSFNGKPHGDITLCGDAQRVGTLRRGYLELAAGCHELTIRAETEGGGKVAVRLYRQVRRQRESWVPFAPETYTEVRHLQFESGSTSSYYHFDAEQPLRMTVGGPTTLRVRTRLDFDHTMNGSQTYTLEVTIDGEVWRTFHFDSTALSSAIWLERQDILPGNRREFRITVPRGRHEVAIHCVRPDACGIATMIHIPKSDLER